MQRLKWQLGTVVETRPETASVKSVILEVPDWTGHAAGQHVDVRLTAEDGYQTQRSYSIGSPPEDKNLMLTVERIDGGEVSPYLTDDLRVGDRVELRGPIGGYFVWNANDEGDNTAPVFFIAGGSGIVPLMAMIRHRANSASRIPVKLLYSSRSYDDIIYRGEFGRLSEKDPSLRIIHTLTRRQPKNWTGYGRRIDPMMLAEIAWPPAENPVAFCCGPTALVETVATYLQELGYRPERIKTERFGPSGD